VNRREKRAAPISGLGSECSKPKLQNVYSGNHNAQLGNSIRANPENIQDGLAGPNFELQKYIFKLLNDFRD
jgi:hypothetical protein